MSPAPREMLHITMRHRKPEEEQQGGSAGCNWSATLTWCYCRTRPYPGDTIKTPFSLPPSKQSLGPSLYLIIRIKVPSIWWGELTNPWAGPTVQPRQGWARACRKHVALSFRFHLKVEIRTGMLTRRLFSLHWLFRVNLWHLAGPRVKHRLWQGHVDPVFSWYSSLFRIVTHTLRMSQAGQAVCSPRVS